MCEAWPFGLSTALHLIYFQIGVLIVERLAGNYSAALYGVAFTIVSAVYLLPTVIFQKLVIPKYHRWAAQDKIRLLAAFQLSAGIMFLTGLGLLALTSTLANTLINLFFGQAYTNGSKVLIILCIGIPFRLISTCCGAALVTREYSKKRLTCMGIVAFVSLGLSIPLTLKYGAIGTAAAAVTSEAILMILYLWIAANYVFGKNTFSNWFKFRTTLETIK